MYGLFLETWRCPEGVELGPNSNGLAVYRSRTKRREPLRLEIQNLENPVVVEFINARDDASRIKFFAKYGFPIGAEPERKESQTRQINMEDGFFPWWVDGAQHGFRDLLTRACGDRVGALRPINERLKGAAGGPLTPTFDLGAEGGTIRMMFKCWNLIAFMDMEVAMAAMQGAQLATCEHCGDVFLTGPLTGRRSHARYCSGRCRVAAMRARNQIKGG
jgi:hypothetical protein